MRNAKTPEAMDMMRAMLDGSSTMRAQFKAQVEGLARAQQEMIHDLDELSRHWFARRQDAAQSALETARAVCSCDDPADALQAYQRFLSGSVGRIAADTLEMQAHAAKMMRAMAGALRLPEAGETPGSGEASSAAAPAPNVQAQRGRPAAHREAA